MITVSHLWGAVHRNAEVEFARKATNGSLDLPLVRIEASQKAGKGIYLADLAKWIDARVEAARKECDQLRRSVERSRKRTPGERQGVLLR